MPAWLRLLHLTKRPGGFETDILNPDFFLSGSVVNLSPYTEMQLSLEAISRSRRGRDSDFACRFPARYLWLTTVIPTLPPPPECPSVSSWVEATAGHGVHLVHVSGFYGNPASAFGHLMLRFSDPADSDLAGLLDHGINFGARIPNRENPLRYIVFGLFGGYEAAFTTAASYLQDHIYASVEARDMWSYALDLSDTQRDLLVLHLWELRDIRFRYFFLNKNCAYRIAELLQLALDVDFTETRPIYFSPIAFFHAVHQADKSAGGQLIADIDYIASDKRKLLDRFSEFSENDKRRVATATKEKKFNLDQIDNPVDWLDFMLDYQNYLAFQSSGSGPVDSSAFKNRLLRTRYRYPPRRAEWDEPDTRAPPGSGPKSRSVGITIEQRKNASQAVLLRVAPFRFDLLGRNAGNLENGAFDVMGLSVSVDQDTFEIDRLAILEVEKLNFSTAELPDDDHFAWRGGLVIENVAWDKSADLNTRFSVGVGQSFGLSSGLGYLLGDLDTLLDPAEVSFLVSAGVVLRWSNVAVSGEVRQRVFSTAGNPQQSEARLLARIGVDTDWSVDIGYRQFSNADQRLSIELIQRW